MSKIETVKVNHYDSAEVIDSFGLDRVGHSVALDQLLHAKFELADYQKAFLEEKRQLLLAENAGWNEQELIVKFVAALFDLAKIEVPKKVVTFYNRPLEGKIGNLKISVVVDCMVATPKKSGNPQSPYFFLQEYKRTKSDAHDPEGQMLAAMLLAQEAHRDEKSVYGAWIQSRNWYFTSLSDKEYTVSKQFDATDKEDLHKIVSMLHHLKTLILNR